jgi:hypothetical protein
VGEEPAVEGVGTGGAVAVGVVGAGVLLAAEEKQGVAGPQGLEGALAVAGRRWSESRSGDAGSCSHSPAAASSTQGRRSQLGTATTRSPVAVRATSPDASG